VVSLSNKINQRTNYHKINQIGIAIKKVVIWTHLLTQSRNRHLLMKCRYPIYIDIL